MTAFVRINLRFQVKLYVMKRYDGKKIFVRPFEYYALLFFVTAFAGWLWEVLLYLISSHTFVNRGVYRGPYLPIYGIGSVILFIFLHNQRKHPVRVFILSSAICTLLEYFGGMWLEWKWGIRWWDYSGQLYHLNGYICLSSSVGFGLGGILLICTFQPVFNKFYHHMTLRLRIVLCLLLVLVFTVDAAYSVILPNTGRHISSTNISFLYRLVLL